jgi:TonB family protein
MSETWKQWEGQIVDEKFPLLRYLGGSEHSAVFLTERHEGAGLVRAAIKLIPAVVKNDELQLSRWRLAAELSHPHLISLYEMGRCELGGMRLLYVVMECAEENLAQVLPNRALTPAEAQAMLESVLDVLAYLHSKGYVHGRIKPINIMANDDQLKVSSDGLRRTGELLNAPGNQGAYDAPENTSGVLAVAGMASPAGDVWSLGMTLIETLTQNLPVTRTAEQKDPLLPQSLPEPFLDIARHCLLRPPQSRWTVAQIAARLEGRAPMPEARTTPPQARTPVRAPQRITRPSRPNTKRGSYAVPIAVGFALVLAAILAGPRLLRPHSEAPQLPITTVEQPIVPTAPKPAEPAPREPATESSRQSVAEAGRNSAPPGPVPASIHTGTTREEETNAGATIPAGALVHGEVARQVLPAISRSARDSIRGTVKVSIKVDVDRSGNVEHAEVRSPGPSKYFAREALKAAQLWEFNPPKAGSQGVLSSWTLRFKFTRGQITVVSTQEMP